MYPANRRPNRKRYSNARLRARLANDGNISVVQAHPLIKAQTLTLQETADPPDIGHSPGSLRSHTDDRHQIPSRTPNVPIKAKYGKESSKPGLEQLLKPSYVGNDNADKSNHLTAATIVINIDNNRSISVDSGKSADTSRSQQISVNRHMSGTSNDQASFRSATDELAKPYSGTPYQTARSHFSTGSTNRSDLSEFEAALNVCENNDTCEKASFEEVPPQVHTLENATALTTDKLTNSNHASNQLDGNNNYSFNSSTDADCTGKSKGDRVTFSNTEHEIFVINHDQSVISSKLTRQDASETSDKLNLKLPQPCEEKFLTISIGGTRFLILLASVAKLPNTRLAVFARASHQERLGLCNRFLSKLSDADRSIINSNYKFHSQTGEYYFERSPTTFDLILNAYRDEEIHCPPTVCALSLAEDMRFWKIDAGLIAPCCATNLRGLLYNCDIDQTSELSKPELSNVNTGGLANQQATRNDIANKLTTIDDSKSPRNLNPSEICNDKNFDQQYISVDSETDNDQQTVVDTTKLSKRSKFLASVRTKTSKMLMTMNQSRNSIEGWKKATWTLLEDPASSKGAVVVMLTSLAFVVITVVVLVLSSMPDFQIRTFNNITGLNDTLILPSLEVVDTVCVSWFTFEYVLRCISAPNLLQFLRAPLSLIDLSAIAPFYVELAFASIGWAPEAFEHFRRSLVLVRILRLLRVFRVLRVLKVARYSRGFQSMGHTLAKSWRELLMLILFMLTTNVIFSTAMYFLEESSPASMFDSIPGAAWWCMITMTTVG